MLERAHEYIKDNESVIEGYLEYLESSDWTSPSKRRDRVAEEKIHVTLLKSIINDIKYVLQQAGEEYQTDNKCKKFVKKLAEEPLRYVTRAEQYFRTERWQDYKGKDDEKVADEKGAEIEFQHTIRNSVVFFREEVAKFNLEGEIRNVLAPIPDRFIISLPLRNLVEKRYPEIAKYIKQRKDKHQPNHTTDNEDQNPHE